ncbi:MAG: chemotaxis response regulator protein-glutamate methylesterase [Acidobacteria bacterium]|nr:MAG: chemotaxis response regulator protein-glutamate methylesterase [Acidobacteriota bacterium]
MSAREHILVVDDSAVVRQMFSMILQKQFSVDTAADPMIAMRRMQKRRPSVIVLDLQMPRMDGFTFLRKIMRSNDPMPVVICSAAAAQGSDTAMRALEEGAVDVMLKPSIEFFEESALQIIDTLRAAAQARIGRRSGGQAILPVRTGKIACPPPGERRDIIAVGASTGGTEALRYVIESLPPNAPGMVVVQHMPEGFTAAFAKRLNLGARVEVKEAVYGDAVVPGRVLIAPGNKHMLVKRSGSRYHVLVTGGPLVSRHRPSVDVLFRSVAQEAGANAVGIIMTGMGDDGAEGMLEMRMSGAHTIAQDEASSVIFGMPKEAIARGGVSEVLSLTHMPSAILRYVQNAQPVSIG